MSRLLVVLMLWSVPAVAQAELTPHQLDVPTREGRRSVTLWVQDGFSINVFAHGLGTARVVAEAPTGELVVSDMNGAACSS